MCVFLVLTVKKGKKLVLSVPVRLLLRSLEHGDCYWAALCSGDCARNSVEKQKRSCLRGMRALGKQT